MAQTEQLPRPNEYYNIETQQQHRTAPTTNQQQPPPRLIATHATMEPEPEPEPQPQMQEPEPQPQRRGNQRRAAAAAPLALQPLPDAMAARLREMLEESESATIVGGDHRDRDARAARSAIAQQTLAWCQQGHYRPDEGGEAVALPIQAAVDSTVLYTPTDTAPVRPKAPQAREPTAVHILEAGVVAVMEAALSAGESVGVLNFASARHPGGGFIKGASAQEEALARATALYPCLTCPAAAPYYETNSQKAVKGIYTDAIIHSPNVPLLRHESGKPLAAPLPISIVTCPAPNLGAMKGAERAAEARDAILRRMEKVLAILAADNVDTIVLGAWGCGVFKHDPQAIAKHWRKLLETKFAGAFKRVIFAVLGSSYPGFAAGFEGRKFLAPGKAPKGPAAEPLSAAEQEAWAALEAMKDALPPAPKRKGKPSAEQQKADAPRLQALREYREARRAFLDGLSAGKRAGLERGQQGAGQKVAARGGGGGRRRPRYGKNADKA